jgi:DNA-binding NarL/FixJ family response regulator
MKRIRIQSDEPEQLQLFSDEMLRSMVQKEARVVALPVGERTVNPEFVRRWRIPPSEAKVLELLVLNCSNGEIAEKLGLKLGTIENRVSSMLGRTAALGVENRADLVYYATKLSPEEPRRLRAVGDP